MLVRRLMREGVVTQVPERAGRMSAPAAGFFCADAAFERDEPMFATASQVERWLLIEQSGPFSGESVPAGRIDARGADPPLEAGARRAGAAGADPAARGVDAEAGLRVFYADVRPGQERLVTLLAADDADSQALRTLALTDPAWTPVTDPLYLVCTHGKHDPCCAVRGRPVAAALAQALGPGPGLGVQPHRRRPFRRQHRRPSVRPVPRAGRAGGSDRGRRASLMTGRVPVHYLRGRSSLSLPAQAAQHFARTQGGLSAADAIGDLPPRQTHPAPGDGNAAWTIVLGTPSGDVSVTVRRTMSATAAQLTCHVSEPKHYPQWELVRIEGGPDQAGRTSISTSSPSNESIPAIPADSPSGCS